MGADAQGSGSMIAPGVDTLIGLVAVYVFIRLARRAGPAAELRWYAGGLVVAAGIYVAFGLVLGGRPLGFELVQLVVFVMLAMAGIRYSPLILAAGWLLHSGWDALHLHPTLSSHAPQWYVFACLSFDVALAAYIVVCRRRYDLSNGVMPSLAEPINQE